jgi:hypothetical protein
LQEQVFFLLQRCYYIHTTHRLWQKVRKRERERKKTGEEKSAAGFAKCIG